MTKTQSRYLALLAQADLLLLGQMAIASGDGRVHGKDLSHVVVVDDQGHEAPRFPPTSGRRPSFLNVKAWTIGWPPAARNRHWAELSLRLPGASPPWLAMRPNL